MASNEMVDFELIRFAIIYPGIIVGALSVFALFNAQLGISLLFVTMMVGGLLYVVCDSDNRAKQSHARRYPYGTSQGKESHFEKEPVDMNRGPLTGRALLLGVGLCFFSVIALSIFYIL